MISFKKKEKEDVAQISDLSWEADIVLNERASRRLAWRVAIGAIIIAFSLSLALILLIPLKQVVPYVVAVDKLTGETSIVTSTKEFVESSAISHKHWIKKFVISRERYKYPLLQHDYDTVKVIAGDEVWKNYSRLFEDEGLDKKLVDKVEIIPSILSVTLGDTGIATVRYELKRREVRGNNDILVTRHVATMRYSYAQKMTLKESQMIDNPLGFTVDAYQTDPELTNSASEPQVKK